MKVRYRVGLVFIITFGLTFAFFNARFLYTYLLFKFNSSSVRPFIFHYDANKAVPLPVAGYKFDKPLPDVADLVIERIGITVPIVFNIKADNKDIYSALEKGVVHYSNTVKPGDLGPSIILGHSSAYPWYKGKYGSVFALLGQLKKGDKLYVRYSDGRIFRYAMTRAVVFNPLGAASDAEVNTLTSDSNSDGSLILISCWPVGTNYRRIAVEASRI